MKKYLISLALLLSISPVAARAAYVTEFGPTPVNNIVEYVNLLLGWLVPVLGGVALLMFIYAGYLYMTSQGNSESINRAKTIIVVTSSGILLLFLARIILNQVGVTTSP